MKTFKLAGVECSRVAQGCMRIGGMAPADIDRLIKTDLELGINFFDHADIYGGGSCETVFGDFLRANPGLRDKMVIQSKCGIRGGTYDFSKDHIIREAEQSLARLGIDSLDFLLLHRPDTLVEPEEVAEAFDKLSREGKVKHFGVSNHNPYQIELLERAMGGEKIAANQLQFSLTNTTMIDAGIHVNMEDGAAVNRDGGVLDYCRLKGITIQPWSPFQHGFFAGPFIGNPEFGKLNEKLDEVSARYGVTPTGMAIAWILRHPAKMQPIVGTTNLDRIAQIAKAADVTITHDEWYELYKASGKTLP
ncbi:MAG: aldo/keto reductase [Clostridia bacterium]|nr:aldo/keto reductase [Clostridia bacterium]MBQ3954470.1 aldo/keto reductase [Clostridia bacterium]